MPISGQRPSIITTAAAALLACAPCITPASARHSDVPDLPPVAPVTAALAIAAMHNELAQFHSSTPALWLEPSHPSVRTSAAQASSRIDAIAAAALNELAGRSALAWEFAAVLDARSSAQRQLADAMQLHDAVHRASVFR